MQGCLACHISYIAKWKPPKDTSFNFLTGELQRSGGFNEKFFSGKNSKIGIPKNLKTVFVLAPILRLKLCNIKLRNFLVFYVNKPN